MILSLCLHLALVAGAGPSTAPSAHPDERLFGGGEVPAQGDAGPIASSDGGAHPIARTLTESLEEDLFGGQQTTSDSVGPATGERSTFESRSGASGTLPPDNPLTVGGLLYLRTQLSAAEGQPPSQWLLSAPFLLDTYLDARPNDRVRGYVLVRTLYDPTYDPTAPSQYGVTFPAQPNPAFLIDQMWIKFDVGQKVFVTAGRQHVKWGTAHFWFPNDLLNPVKLGPLAVFDQRTGVTMLKANLPLEAAHLNVTGIALLEGLQQANQLGKVGGAGRVEYVLGTAELGIDVVDSQVQHPRIGGDVSLGLWDFDVYAEGVLIDGRDNPVWQELAQPNPAQGNVGNYQLTAPGGYQPEIATGLNYSLRYGDNRVLTFGGEYFYNALGYSNYSIYPWLLLNNDFNFFYVGQHYAGVYLLADKPGSWYNSTVNLSTLANLSDQSFITRIDFFQTVLTHLRFEAFAQVHYGANGEFHLSFNSPGGTVGTMQVPAINVPAPSFDVGLALRVSL